MANVTLCDNCGERIGDIRRLHLKQENLYMTGYADPQTEWDFCGFTCLHQFASDKPVDGDGRVGFNDPSSRA